MDGIYGHITPAMRKELLSTLENLWTVSLAQRAALSPNSAVPLLDALLKGSFGSEPESVAPKPLPETDKPDSMKRARPTV
jgi:hypothetical protein